MSHATSLVIPVFNQLAYTKICIDSLLADSDRPAYELIVVDNGSSDGTREYLQNKSRELERTNDRLTPILNNTNLGVAPAWNQGLRAAASDMIGILNNDIKVTRGWYRGLEWALDFHKLGLVSPFASNGELGYDLDSRAEKFTQKNRNKLWPDYDFCAVVLHRATFERLGFFDENYLVGGYEDQDYAFRMREAGIGFGVSGAAFIHHFGSQTLGEFKKRGDKHASHNRDYFISKWKRDPSEGVRSVTTKLKRSWRNLKLRWDYM